MKRNHRQLQIWQSAMDLVPLVYAASSRFPREERFGLGLQMRRAAVSIPANIAEGAARSGTRELLHYLGIASASLSELDTHVEIARRLGYIESGELAVRMDELALQFIKVRSRLKRKAGQDLDA